jgi:hypothetical protein
MYDVVLLLDVVEHFDKVSGVSLINEAIYVANKRVVIWIPFGVCPQGPMEANPYQVHRSTWLPEDFAGKGTTVEVLPQFHKHFNPPVDAGWVVIEKVGKNENRLYV